MSLSTAEATTFPAAELDRRFYAFTLDRLIAWTLDGVAAVAAYQLLIEPGHVWAGIAVVVAVVLLVGLGFALLTGLRGSSPGKSALGLRVVHDETGTPVGVRAALLRTFVLGVSALPTFGLGVATLAWTAVMDRGRQRRGWHDQLSHSIVVDVRPVPVSVEEAPSGPRHIVNLTAMRLVPAPQAAPVPVPVPARPARSQVPAPPQAPGLDAAAAPGGAPPATPVTPVPSAPVAPPSAPPTPAPRRRLGPPLVDHPPVVEPPAVPTPAAPVPLPVEPAPRTDGRSTAERTVIRDGGAPGRSLARWRVSFDSGESFLVEGLALVGRRPEPRPGEPVRHLVPLRSGDMSLSKTHAQFQVAPDGVLVVMDRGSTNGSVLVRQGVPRDLTAGRPATLLDGDLVRFGDRLMTVVREG